MGAFSAGAGTRARRSDAPRRLFLNRNVRQVHGSVALRRSGVRVAGRREARKAASVEVAREGRE